ncbi:AraC family transcriptional regulator [Paenibacillus sp. GSMTC-2017]|uniref:AraC family transcriptional regulator n=1 Tax=Paenibacillus sp. GSMTC-2017 TaxID=2794350 RepID=UPI0018D92075|nr:AraC family transcriptional regulator [Paenibacillus sp. GSMTC-2017]MBH5318358.1 AraC family transcriptional regulator [Paenibacillus sp. GSMTC-2017]
MKRDYHLNKDFPFHITRWVPNTILEPFHWHNAFEIGYCISGSGFFYLGGKKYEVNPGDVFVVSNMEKHRAQSNPIDPSTFYFVKFDASLIGGAGNELLAPFIVKSDLFINKIDGQLQAASQIGGLMQHIWEEIEQEDKAYKSMVKGLLIQVCTLLLRHYVKEQTMDEWNRSIQAYKKLSPALDRIHELFHENIQLKDIAECLSLSTSRTYHLFKETMGEGFKEYLTKIRIHESKKRLSDPNVSITEIYLSCGFQGHAAFYRSFKKIVGVTPKEYRRYIIT